MIRRALNALMDWAIARNGDGTYEGEDSPRWAYTIKDDVTGDPYLSRLLLPRVRIGRFEFRPMLHRFHRPDADAVLHNHPWDFGASLILLGGYLEERLDMTRGGARQQLWVRRFNLLTWRDFHRVVELLGQGDDGRGEVWTLFVTGKRIQDWGFLEPESFRFTQWQKFLARKRAPHRWIVDQDETYCHNLNCNAHYSAHDEPCAGRQPRPKET